MKARKKLSKANGYANGHDKDKPLKNGHDPEAIEELPARKAVITATKPHRVRIKPHTDKMKMFHSYDAAVHPKQVLEMAMNGATEREIRTALGISQPVFDMWRARHAAFAAALAIGPNSKLADDRVQRSLFEMANGYDQPATKIFMDEGVPVAVDYVERVPKNIAAAKLWLANRDPANWGRNPEQGAQQLTPSVLNVKMIQGMDVEQLRSVVQLLRGVLAPTAAAGGLKRLDAVDVTPEPTKETA